MRFYVSAQAAKTGDGTRDYPFQTISQAAALAEPGDEVLVEPGVYREWVNPPRGGSGPDGRIVYRSRVPGGAVITGAEPLGRWAHYQGNVWVARVDNGIFGDYNPYTTCIQGDWYFAPPSLHTGQIYWKGRAMYEVLSLEQVLSPVKDPRPWAPEESLSQWYTCQESGQTLIYANFQGSDPRTEQVEFLVRRRCFFPDAPGRNYITVSGFVLTRAATQWAPPTAFQDGLIGPHWSKGWIIEECEVSESRCSGISLGKYLQPSNENKWSRQRLKDGTQNERDVVCLAQYEGWSRERVGSHVVRRCHIHHCGQAGIVGHLGCVFSAIEDNHIHHINTRRDLVGAEIGGIKLHAAIDTVIRGNHIHHCTRGLWLDWQAQGTRVTGNCFHHNVIPEGRPLDNPMDIGEDLFVEVSHGPTLIDHNFLLSPFSARLSAQGIALAHNLIAGALTGVGLGGDNGGVKFASPRYTPYHFPHRTEIAGFMTMLHGDVRFYNNIFCQQPVRRDLDDFRRARQARGFTGLMACPNLLCGTKPYDGYPLWEEYRAAFEEQGPFGMFGNDRYYDHLPVYTGGNVFFNGAQPCDREQDGQVVSQPVRLELVEGEEGWKLETDLYRHLPRMETRLVDTDRLGMAFEPEQRFEHPDGTPIRMDRDYFGRLRQGAPLPGPLAQAAEEVVLAAGR